MRRVQLSGFVPRAGHIVFSRAGRVTAGNSAACEPCHNNNPGAAKNRRAGMQ
jgi:hypothetical protein